MGLNNVYYSNPWEKFVGSQGFSKTGVIETIGRPNKSTPKLNSTSIKLGAGFKLN